MFKTLKAMFDYLNVDFFDQWEAKIAYSLLFSMLVFLSLEIVFFSSVEVVRVLGVTAAVQGDGVDYLSFSHVMLLIFAMIITCVMLIPVIGIMSVFKEQVEGKRCSILLIPISSIILGWSCLLVFLYRNILRVVKYFWSFTVFDESKKSNVKINNHSKTIS